MGENRSAEQQANSGQPHAQSFGGKGQSKMIIEKDEACGEQQQADAEQGNVILRFVFRRVCRLADEYERQSKKRFRRDKIPDESQRTYCGEKQDDMRKNFFPVLE